MKKKKPSIEIDKPKGDFTLDKWFKVTVEVKKGKLSLYIDGVGK